MSAESTALQVLLPSFTGTTVPAEVLTLLEEGLGGLCLFGSNTADGPEAVAAYTASVRSVSPGAVVAVDEEGGDVTRHNREPDQTFAAPRGNDEARYTIVHAVRAG